MSLLTLIPAIVQGMSLPGIHVTPIITPCGEDNAYYSPSHQTLIVCTELVEDMPDIVPLAVAHEMGHAIVDQLHIDVGNGQYDEEDAADQLGGLYMAVAHPDLLLYAAIAFGSLPDSGGLDEHRSSKERAFTFMCIEDGLEPVPVNVGCQIMDVGLAHLWSVRIQLAEAALEPGL